MSTPVRIGARGSRLSLTQSGHVQAQICAALGGRPEDAETLAPLVVIKTSGDRIQDRRLLEEGGKGLFTKELEEALLDGRIDCAVHSMKDVPAELPPGLAIAAIPEREDPRDAFVSVKYAAFEDLPTGASLGTASLRRQAQALHRRADLDVQVLRGNVDTRLAKLEAGEFDAIVLAMSGLKRLGLEHVVREAMDPTDAPPAPGQGALAVEVRAEDVNAPWAVALRHAPTVVAVAAERGALEALEGSCRTAMGAHAWFAEGQLELVVEALLPDGSRRFRQWARMDGIGMEDVDEARAFGLELGRLIRAEAGDQISFV